jgi:F0F1-type ATP synthase delta subunit
MINVNVKKLVDDSFKDGKLIQENVEYIAERLSRKELKQYIHLLKEEELKKQVFVTSAETLSKEDLGKIQKLYPGMEIVSSVDKSMISGVRIVENNKEYEINLNRTFHDIIGFLSTNDR